MLVGDREKALSGFILEAFDALSPGGGYRFAPSSREPTDPNNPRDPNYDGMREDIVMQGRVLAVGSTDGATYCCGVTFACWWDALARAGCPQPADWDDAEALLAEWFCPTMGHPGVVDALVHRGWGARVSPAEAQPGDLVQYWRRTDLSSPSGHSAIWLAETGGTLHYASSQPATDGVGRHAEVVGPGWEIHVVRPWLLRLEPM